MSVGANALGPLAGVVGPHGHVVVQVVGEVVGDEVLPRHPQVYGIPELELFAQFL